VEISSNGREPKEDPGIAGALSPPPFEKTALAELTGDVEPRRPLRQPLERALFLLLVAGGLAAAALSMTNLRPDLERTSWTVTYGPAMMEMLAGWAAFLLAMAWSVPGARVSRSRSALWCGAMAALALAAAFAAPHFVPAAHPGASVGFSPAKGFSCLGFEMVLGVPMLMAALWLVARGASAAPRLAGALAGLGAGLAADAAMHLECGAVDPAHTVIWHLGAVALLALLGALAGRFMPKW
jgi:hypothetical protein